MILCGECVTVLKRIKQPLVALTLFSPPYDNIRDYDAGGNVDLSALGAELLRITKDGGVCAIVINDGTQSRAKTLTTSRLIVNWCDCLGWRLFEQCIYSRHGNPGAWWSQRFRVDHEYILFFFKGKTPRVFDKAHLAIPSKHAGKVYSGTDRLTSGGFTKIDSKAVNETKCRGTIWHYASSNSEGNKLKLEHPATYPDKLADDIIRCFTNEGDLVLDPMMGSGTTCVMAQKANRKYIGIDTSKKYVNIASERLAKEGD